MTERDLLPPNATDAERALSGATARIGAVPSPIRKLWSANDCPVELLPWLAWALNLQTWRASWPERVKRSRIRSAIDVHRRKGTAYSVRTVVESFGASIALREWWQDDIPGEPHTFAITLNINAGLPQTAEYQRDIIRAVDMTKPVRSHYTLTAGLSASGGIGVLATARPITYRRLTLRP